MLGSNESPNTGSAVIDRDLLADKLAALYDRIQRVKVTVPESAEALRADRNALDLVSFNLMLSVQVCADMASHLIADEGWPAASSLAEGFKRLEQFDVIDRESALALQRAVGLRNVVAHGYAGIDVERCFDAAQHGLGDLESFARQVSAWAEAQRAR
jgi:uncharacterized protein YutE (UPF0331/DUF86 family)